MEQVVSVKKGKPGKDQETAYKDRTKLYAMLNSSVFRGTGIRIDHKYVDFRVHKNPNKKNTIRNRTLTNIQSDDSMGHDAIVTRENAKSLNVHIRWNHEGELYVKAADEILTEKAVLSHYSEYYFLIIDNPRKNPNKEIHDIVFKWIQIKELINSGCVFYNVRGNRWRLEKKKKIVNPSSLKQSATYVTGIGTLGFKKGLVDTIREA